MIILKRLTLIVVLGYIVLMSACAKRTNITVVDLSPTPTPIIERNGLPEGVIRFYDEELNVYCYLYSDSAFTGAYGTITSAIDCGEWGQ